MKQHPIVIAAALVGALCLPASAQDKPNEVVAGATAPGQAVIARTSKITATVEAVDLDKREVTLKGPRGKVLPLQVGPEVHNLDKVKVGDRVAVEYLEALSLTLKKDGKEVRGSKLAEGGARSAPGEMPAGVVAQQLEVTADVTAVDRKKQIVTLHGPNQTVDLKVRDPEQLKLIKVGDQVQAVYTEALALGLEPAGTHKKK
jgi:Cu/Ag efflux protein CusF